MKLSTKGRYGLRAIVDLARFSEEEPVSISSISAREDISEGYLEQLMALLKKAGLVKSIRGAAGGYVLARPAGQISVGDVLRALEGRLRGIVPHLLQHRNRDNSQLPPHCLGQKKNLVVAAPKPAAGTDRHIGQ